MIRDVTNFKGNKFIRNILISLRINFFWETEKRFFEISFKMDIPKGMNRFRSETKILGMSIRFRKLICIFFKFSRNFHYLLFYIRIEKLDLRHFFRNSFAIRYFLSLFLYIYMICDVTNFKRNKFITNVLISLRINFFRETEKSKVKTNE